MKIFLTFLFVFYSQYVISESDLKRKFPHGLLTEDYGIQNPSIFPDPSMRTLRMDYFLEIVKYYKLIWNGELKEFKKEHQ